MIKRVLTILVFILSSCNYLVPEYKVTEENSNIGTAKCYFEKDTGNNLLLDTVSRKNASETSQKPLNPIIVILDSNTFVGVIERTNIIRYYYDAKYGLMDGSDREKKKCDSIVSLVNLKCP